MCVCVCVCVCVVSIFIFSTPSNQAFCNLNHLFRTLVRNMSCVICISIAVYCIELRITDFPNTFFKILSLLSHFLIILRYRFTFFLLLSLYIFFTRNEISLRLYIKTRFIIQNLFLGFFFEMGFVL